MYLPEQFAVTDPAEIDLVLADLRLGCLVTRDEAGFFATHIPMLFDPVKRVLTGHMSRANPHPKRSGDSGAIAIFQGLDAYVTPNWYPSKHQHGKTVPTWNYQAVHLEGTLSWHEDKDWLRGHLGQLTHRHEGNRAEPWKLTDAPEDYIAKQIGGIIGMELAVRSVEIKRKLSQNRTEEDRQGVIDGLRREADPAARQMAELMERKL